MSKKPRVLVTLDSMKDPNTGFFYFGKAMLENLLNENNGRFRFSFYVKDATGFFKGKKLSLYNMRKWHKHFLPFYRSFNLTHITDQFCRVQPRLIGGKKILTIHDLNVLHEPGLSSEKINENLETLRGHVAHCDKIVAISNFVATDMKKTFPEAAGKVTVIYNGSDKLSVADSHTPAYVPEGPFIFTLGPLNPKKNFHVLPALLQHNNYRLVVGGIIPVPEYTELFWNEARKYGCEDRVKLTGILNDADKIWYYKHCAAFAFPSLAEGFGLPVIEAMSFGKPVFLSTCTSLPEIGGDAAFYFDSFDALAMQKIFADGMESYMQNSMENVIKKRAEVFSWSNTARQYLDLYNEVLSS